MQKIIPCLWFDGVVGEAVEFYTSIFEESEITMRNKFLAGPAEGREYVTFKLSGMEFFALDGGSYFSFSPAISFVVNCDSKQEQEDLWLKLSEKGMVLMEIGEYPFSESYGWLQDRFGVSWQLNLKSERQKIVPFLMFTGDHFGKAEKAVHFYTEVIGESNLMEIVYNQDESTESERPVYQVRFQLGGILFSAMDSGYSHTFNFTPAISFIVNCDSQLEINRLWKSFTEQGEGEQCGWLRDQFGVSWQIVPTILPELLGGGDREKGRRVTETLLKMEKIDIEALELAASSPGEF